MKSGRTFIQESIALRQREARRAGRILALQGQNPGQLSFELIQSSERICPEPRCALPPSVLALSLERAVQPDIILSGSALRKRNHSISFSSQRYHSPGTKDSYTHPTTPSAGRTGGVLTCLIKSLPLHFRLENQRSNITKYQSTRYSG